MKKTTEHPEGVRRKRRIVRKRKANKDNGKRKLIVVLFLFVCAAIIFTALKAPFFNIKAVVCDGQQNLTQEEILNIARIKTGANIFSTNIQAAERRLDAKPEIAEVTIKRVFPNRIKITVTESEILAYTQWESKFLLLDRNGKVIKSFADTETQSVEGIAKVEGLQVVSDKPGTSVAAEDDARAGELFKCIGMLAELDMMDKVNYINFEDLSDLQIDYENRLYMLLGSYDNLEYKLKFVKKVIDENISGYEKALLDYRGEKLYVGPRDELNAGNTSAEGETAAENTGADTQPAVTDGGEGQPSGQNTENQQQN